MEPIHENVTVRDDGLVETENGALAFASHPSPFADFFFKVSSMRQWDADAKRAAFRKCLDANREMALRLLFFVRDIRGGLGERGLFRDVFAGLPDGVAAALLPLVPEFGRWDDVWAVLGDGVADAAARPVLRDAVFAILRRRWEEDLRALADPDGRPSLLAKWLPSVRGVSAKQESLAKELAFSCFRLRPADYRRKLSALRARLRVTERAMCAGEWGAVDYGAVPSKAALRYRAAFSAHDPERYKAYLAGLAKGTSKANADALFPYEIVAAYLDGYEPKAAEDPLLEAQWRALPLPKGILGNAIVVRDGSGSMTTPVSGGRATALDVATSLAILASEHLEGPFANRFISFSQLPRLVDLSGCSTLREKLVRTYGEDETANTDVQRTMRLVLDAVSENGIPQEEIPAVVIVSDMEFDEARGAGWSWRTDAPTQEVLFETIRREWKERGYDLPTMVFWNVASRTGAVPLQENGNGLVLASGFSQNILDMLSGVDPEDTLRRKLAAPRYDRVAAVFRGDSAQ
ncbi:MAG: DUF2828 family protein [Kiritimatiellae bacterium]|nr:DUF2828 family protein [Kiritimatiellia bacterium]